MEVNGKQDVLEVDVRGPVAVLTLNRPHARNGLSLDLLIALNDALEIYGEAPSVSAIVITGAPPAFCAGHDLKEMAFHRSDTDKGKAFYHRAMHKCSETMLAVTRCPKPVIAAVNGVASAAGCQLVASCDLAIAGKSAAFVTPGVDIGLFCSTPMVPLSRNVPRKTALELLFLGEPVSAERAKEIGLVNAVAADEETLALAVEWANKIATKSPLALRIGKEAFYRQAQMSIDDAYRYASEVMVENMMAAEAIEGIGAFLEKREPDWSKA